MSETIPKTQRFENEEKVAQMHKIFSYVEGNEQIYFNPNIIVALAGSFVEAKGAKIGHEGYIAPSYADDDIKGYVSGGKARIIATAEAHTYFKDAILITNSKNIDTEDSPPTQAAVYATELQSYIEEEVEITQLPDSTTTVGGIIDLVLYMCDKGDECATCAIVTNAYHVPRVQKMIEMLETLFSVDETVLQEKIALFRKKNKKIIVIPAEDILCVRDARYEKLYEAVQQTESFKERVAAEEQGLKDLIAGKYNKNLPSVR